MSTRVEWIAIRLLRPALEALGIPFLVSGDATGPKDYVKAIYEGFVAGNTIAE